MIARVWQGATAAEKASQYYDYLEKTGLKEYRATEGNRGVWVLHRIEAGQAEFVLISLWDSLEAIRRFAGEDIHQAVFYPEDKDYLIELTPEVRHYEILARP